jgi:lysophospholipase L1-like esterase
MAAVSAIVVRQNSLMGRRRGGLLSAEGFDNVHRYLKIFVVNLCVFLSLLAGVEICYRIFRPREDLLTNAVWQSFHSYVMFLAAPGEFKSWTNRNTGQEYEARVVTNALGFNDRHEFSYAGSYAKAANEKVVLFTGGSAAWGVGATSTDATIAGRMEYHLNALQQQTKYTVINLAMGGWIAYQQFLGLQLWGDSFHPDWVVVMDGFNDAQVGCAFSQGVGNPFYYATIKSYIDGYLFSTLRPVFFRGWLENQLIAHSAAYRAVMGKQYVRQVQTFDDASPEISVRRQILPTGAAALPEMLAFYLKAQSAMLNLYPHARYILSTQPLMYPFSDFFPNIYIHPAGSEERHAAAAAVARQLEDGLKQYENQLCGQKLMQPTLLYLFIKGAFGQERIAEEAKTANRRVEYYNAGVLLPDERSERVRYFIDGVHLTDEAANVIGKFYAERILAQE